MSLADPPPLRDRRDSDGRSRKSGPSRSASPISKRGRRGAFPKAALKLFDHGLLPVPCSPLNIKAPGISFASWQREPGRDVVTQWAEAPRYHSAQIGVLTGKGRFPVTVVDVDDISRLEALVALLGPTPLMIATPSGGRHLYYRFNGEAGANLRSSGWAVDVKGKGGFAVAPPTRKPVDDAKAKAGRYSIVQGSWKQLDRLPSLPQDWRTRLGADRRSAVAHAGANSQAPNQGRQDGLVKQGHRNTTAFSAGMRLARIAQDAPDLFLMLQDWNASNCDPPLDDQELARTAASAWNYQVTGRNWTGVGGVNLTQDDVRDIGDADAVFTWLHLRFAHGARSEAFALVVPRMVEEDSIPGLRAHRLRQAIGRLLAKGYLRCVHQGGRHKGDPSLYRLAQPRRPAAV